MSSTLADMTAALRTLLMDHYRASTPAVPGQPFLAFELGTPVPDETFRLPPTNPQYSPAAALEYMSNQSNVAPRVQGDVLFETIARIDSLYGILLMGATPADPSGMELLGSIKRSATDAFDNTLGSVVAPMDRFRPVHADPVNWYDQSVARNWTTLSLDQFDNPPPAPPAPSPPNPPHHGGGGGGGGGSPVSPFLLMWRPVPGELRPLLKERVTTQVLTRFNDVAAEVQRGNEEERAPAGDGLPQAHHTSGRGRAAGGVDERISVLVPGGAHSLVHEQITQPLRFGSVVERAAATSPATPAVTSDGFSIKVEACLVHLRRPWLSDGLLTLSNWFVPTLPKGSFSAGTGADSATPLSVLPVACVCIRNVAIKARWSPADLAQTVNSSHLGAFSLMGRTFDQNSATLTVPGMQLIAWICQPMPVLPPLDPVPG